MCRDANTIPVNTSLPGDQLTPASACERIVGGSEPAREYQETLNKAQSILSALTIANAWVTGRVLLRSRRPD